MNLKNIGKVCPFRTDFHTNQRTLHNTPYFQEYYLVSKDLFRPLSISLISSSIYPALIQPSNDLPETITSFPTLIIRNGSCFCRRQLKNDKYCSSLTIVLFENCFAINPITYSFSNLRLYNKLIG